MFSAFAARFVLATRALCLGAMVVFAGAQVVVAEESPGFHLCNKTPDVINVALGRYKDGTFVSNGWWVIAPEQCADLINRALSAGSEELSDDMMDRLLERIAGYQMRIGF